MRQFALIKPRAYRNPECHRRARERAFNGSQLATGLRSRGSPSALRRFGARWFVLVDRRTARDVRLGREPVKRVNEQVLSERR